MMSGRDIRDTVGLIAVVAGLAFVAWEIRQNTTAVKGATVQAIADMSFQATLTVSQDDELAEAYRIATLEGPDSLTDHQQMLMASFTTASLRIVETRFRQVELGILEEAEVLVAGGASSFYQSQWFDTWWDSPQGRGSQSPDFAAWVDDTLLAP